MSLTEFGLSLGSNLSDRLQHLRDARARIRALPGVTVLAQSPVYETEPVDVSAAHRDKPYLNAVLIVAAATAPDVLAAALRQIETDLGRVRDATDRNAPRPIDVDLLYAGALAVATPALTLPHPRWHERRFVLQPLADVRPALVLPGQTATVRDLLAALPPRPAVKLLTRDW